MAKLIEFGWDQPDTAFLRAHIQELELSPFDGVVYGASYQAAGTSRKFETDCWGTKLFTWAELGPARADLARMDVGRLQDNYLRFNIGAGNVDWFDDFTAILGNARLAGKLAQAGRSRGVWFDTEPFGTRPWEYPSQRDAATKSYAQYAAQVNLRGRQFMNALQQGFPGLVLVLTIGASQVWDDMQTKSLPLSQLRWGLLSPFVNGMVATCQSPTRIVDGNERAYGAKTAAQIQAIATSTKTGMLPIVGDPVKYAEVGSCGFGLWLDYLSNPAGATVLPWSAVNGAANYYTPDAFQTVVGAALALADDLVWVYTEIPRWWSNAGTVNLPPAYVEALWQARGL